MKPHRDSLFKIFMMSFSATTPTLLATSRTNFKDLSEHFACTEPAITPWVERGQTSFPRSTIRKHKLAFQLPLLTLRSAFYQHHAQMDRIYWMWQALHPQIANTINGTRTFRDTPPSANATVDDLLNVGVLGKHLPIKNMFNTLGNDPLCYIYA